MRSTDAHFASGHWAKSSHLWVSARLANHSVGVVPDEDLTVHAGRDGHRQDRAEGHIFNAVRMACRATPDCNAVWWYLNSYSDPACFMQGSFPFQ